MKLEHNSLVNKLRRYIAVWAVVCENPVKPSIVWILLRRYSYSYGTDAGSGQKDYKVRLANGNESHISLIKDTYNYIKQVLLNCIFMKVWWIYDILKK